MKRAIMVLGCLFIFASGWAFGRTKSAVHNGEFWNEIGSAAPTGATANFTKAMYVIGFTGGFGRAEWDAYKPAGGLPKPKPSQHLSPAQLRHGAAAVKDDLAMLVAPFHSPGQIVTEMNAFYSDDRNAPVCWDDALIFSVSSLEGSPPTGKELSAARARGAKSASCVGEWNQ